MVDIIQMNEGHVQGILDTLCPAYYAEAYKELTPSYEFAAITIGNYLENNSVVAVDGDRVVAVGSAICTNTYFVEREFDVVMFYVHPDYRRSGVASAMRDALITMKDFLGAKVSYTSCLSGISDTNRKSFENLWAKKGYKLLGTVMYKIEGNHGG